MPAAAATLDSTVPPAGTSALKRLAIALGSLTLVAAVVLPLFIWYGYAAHGSAGIAAACVAAGVCWLGAAAALTLAGLMQGSQNAVSGTLGGMVFRLGLPLGAGVLLDRQGGDLAQAGVFGMIMAFYLITLLTETLLSVWLVRSAKE